MTTRRPCRPIHDRWLILPLLALGIVTFAAAAFAQAPIPAQLKARPGFAPKDFSVIQEGEWFHAFYIETDNSILYDTGTNLGHSRSKDLYHWEYLDSNFVPGSASFDNARVWAPHVVKVDGVFYLFYTGISSDPSTLHHQSIGVATSTDLSCWTRYPLPIVECAGVAGSRCSPAMGELRDPFALQDPTTAGRWLVYFTEKVASPDVMVVGIAGTTEDLTEASWADLGPVWTPSDTWPFNEAQTESPHLFTHDGLWYLFYTSNAGNNQITIWTSPDSPAPGATWTRRMRLGKLPSEEKDSFLGYNTTGWFASELFKDAAGREYFGVVHQDSAYDYQPRRLQFRQVVWTPGNWKFSLASPFRVSAIAWSTETGNHSVNLGQRADLVVSAWSGSGRTGEFEVVEKDAGQPDQLLPPGSLGLPASLALDGATTVYEWDAFGEPDDDGTPNRLEIAVRVKGEPSVASPTLYIDLPGGGDHDPYETEARARRVIRGDGSTTDPPKSTPALPTLRALRETPLGTGVGLLVDLPEPANAKLEIFDPQGRRVRTLRSESMPRGASVVLWDRLDDAGARVRDGLFFVRLQALGHRVTSRIVVTSAAR